MQNTKSFARPSLAGTPLDSIIRAVGFMPVAKFAYVLIDPVRETEARKWLREHQETILTPTMEETL